jgi:hypothetical protein
LIILADFLRLPVVIPDDQPVRFDANNLRGITGLEPPRGLVKVQEQPRFIALKILFLRHRPFERPMSGDHAFLLPDNIGGLKPRADRSIHLIHLAPRWADDERCFASMNRRHISLSRPPAKIVGIQNLNGTELLQPADRASPATLGEVRDGGAILQIDLALNLPQRNRLQRAMPLQDAQRVTRLHAHVLMAVPGQ